jgi:hypothetical protein
MNARCAPERVRDTRLADQLAQPVSGLTICTASRIDGQSRYSHTNSSRSGLVSALAWAPSAPR